MASSEAIWFGSTLFAKVGVVVNSRIRVKTDGLKSDLENDIFGRMTQQYPVTPWRTSGLHVRQPITHIFTEWIAAYNLKKGISILVSVGSVNGVFYRYKIYPKYLGDILKQTVHTRIKLLWSNMIWVYSVCLFACNF